MGNSSTLRRDESTFHWETCGEVVRCDIIKWYIIYSWKACRKACLLFFFFFSGPWLYYAKLWAVGNSMEESRLACQGVLPENLALCLPVFQLQDQMSDATRGQPFNTWLLMYLFETILKTGLWQTVSKGRGCCVSLVTFIASVSTWCFIFSYVHQEFSGPRSVKLDAKIQMVEHQQLGWEDGHRKDKSNIYPQKNICTKVFPCSLSWRSKSA